MADIKQYRKARKLTRCRPVEYYLYEFSNKSPQEINTYITEYRKYRLINAIGDSSWGVTMFGGKKLFNERFSEFLGREWIDPSSVSYEEFVAFIRKYQRVIIKPDKLLQGIGISIYDMNNDERTIDELYKFCCANQYIVEQIIKQCSEMDALNHGSVNTIRVSTLCMNGVVHMISAGLRIGDGSSCTDNFHNNGFGCAIDLKNGMVISDGYNNRLIKRKEHPLSGFVFKGFQVPMWDQVIELTTKAAKKAGEYPRCKWIAWDVALTDTPILIEGNWSQGCDIIQIGQSGKYDITKKIISEALSGKVPLKI